MEKEENAIDTGKKEVQIWVRVTKTAEALLKEKARNRYLDLKDYMRSVLYADIDYMPPELE